MSEQNIEAVRRMFGAVDRHDVHTLEAVLSEDFEFQAEALEAAGLRE
jgi:ketosteroid isomerase-like protein